MEERTIVLLGKTGVGKSATGNTILRRNTFQSRRSVNSVTKQCKDEQAEISGKRIRVVDTPGLFDTNIPEEELAKEIARSVYLSREGVHAFILVFPYGRFTEQEEEIIKRIQKVFGEEVRNHMILLFTHGDEAEDGGRCYTIEAYEETNRSTWGQYWDAYKKFFLVGSSQKLRPTQAIFVGAVACVLIGAGIFSLGRTPASGLARGAVKGLLEGGVACTAVLAQGGILKRYNK